MERKIAARVTKAMRKTSQPFHTGSSPLRGRAGPATIDCASGVSKETAGVGDRFGGSGGNSGPLDMISWLAPFVRQSMPPELVRYRTFYCAQPVPEYPAR